MPSNKSNNAKQSMSAFAVQYTKPNKNKHSPNTKQDKMNIVQRSTSTLFVIPSEDVFLHQSKRSLVLCEEFDSRYPETSCRYGSKCRWVHACTDRAIRKYIHINWLWRSRKECEASYHLMEEGRTVRIKAPVSSESTEETFVDSGRVLQTRCLFNDPKRPAAHCAHFCYGRECHLGALCDFAHVIHIDGNASPGERARPPLVNAERFPLQRAQNNTPTSQPPTAMPTPVTDSLIPVDSIATPLMDLTSESFFSMPRTPPSTFLQADMFPEPSVVKCGGGRWRYNPYGAVVMPSTDTACDVSAYKMYARQQHSPSVLF